MIRGEHGQIRGSEPDDAAALHQLYDPGHPRAALLDQRAELALPTRDELAELLTKKEVAQGQLFTLEQMSGDIAGFCSIRGAHPEARFAEAALLLLDEAAYDTPLADEASRFLLRRAFVQMRLNKLFAQCLDNEAGLRRCLIRNGFVSEGKRRDLLYSGGHRYDLEALAYFARDAHFDGGR